MNVQNEIKESIESNFETIYRDFRLRLYKHIFGVMGEREGSLTVTEFFAVETIGLMGAPTVSEFAEALSITSSHAAYKVRQLIDKGYVLKVPTDDKRTFRLKTTDKFLKYYHDETSYGRYIFDFLSSTMTEEELAQTSELFEKFVKIIKEKNNG